MRARQILIAIAVLLFLAFLASPAFIDSVYSDGSVTMLPGYGAVLWWGVLLPSTVFHSRRDAVLLAPLLLAQVAFMVLPVLVVLKRFRSLALRVFLGLVFVAGFVSMASLISMSEGVGFGAYLWLVAAVAAATLCLLPPYDT